MSDGIRRIVALSVLMLGTGLLWVAGRTNGDAEKADTERKAALDEARERAAQNDPRLKGAYRYDRGGWVYVHLEGEPAAVGFQHGFLLASEIADAFPEYALFGVFHPAPDDPYYDTIRHTGHSAATFVAHF